MKQYEENPTFMKSLEDIAREGARKVLAQAIENEAKEFAQHYSNRRDSNGHLVVKRNGYFCVWKNLFDKTRAKIALQHQRHKREGFLLKMAFIELIDELTENTRKFPSKQYLNSKIKLPNKKNRSSL